MGEEYGETAPFPYFIDHGDPGLVEAVRAGAPRSSQHLVEPGELLDPADRVDVRRCAHSTGHCVEKGDHAALLKLYRHLIALRRANPALRRSQRGQVRSAR